MGEVHGGVLAYRQMHDGTPLFEGRAECLRICVVRATGPAVEGDVDILYIITECEHSNTVMPDPTEYDTADSIGQEGAVREDVEGAGHLVGRVEVEGVV